MTCAHRGNVEEEKSREPDKRRATGERRKYIRYSCNTELKTILDFNSAVARRASGRPPSIVFRKGQTAVVRNISEKGIALEVGQFLPAGMVMKISINSPVTPPIETDARIAWSSEIPSGQGYVLGMAFRHMREKHRRNLDRLLHFLQAIPE